MKVLLTSLGHLGGTIARLLAGKHEVRVLRRRHEDVPYELIIGDIRAYDDVRRAAEEVDAIIHTAALWGKHLRTHTYRDFHETNVTGTFNVLEAAREEDIPKVVFSSSIVVHGLLGRKADERLAGIARAIAVDENFPRNPLDAYALSKVIGETMCEHYSNHFPISTICLRYGHFPDRERDAEYAAHFHRGFLVDVEDCARANILALENDSIKHACYQIASDVPYTAEDSETLISDTEAVLDKYFKDEVAFLRSNGAEIGTSPIRVYYKSGKPERELGFEPEHNTKTLVAALKLKQIT